MHLCIAYKLVEEQCRSNSKEKSDTSRQCEREMEEIELRETLALDAVRLLYLLLEGKHCQQRNGKFCYHEDGSHGAELGIHRHIIDEEIGQSHEVSAPREQY